MHRAKPFYTKVVMSVLTAILASAAVLGNGVVIAVIARFKSLRTVPNILVANLALVDLFNAAINMPPYMIYTVIEASWFRGKTLGIITSFLNRLFLILNLASMLAMMTNMNLAISFDLKYLAWKTNKKALVCVFLIWFVSVVLVTLFSIPLLDIDLGDARVIEYRTEIYKQGKHFVASVIAFFIICGAAVYYQTTRAIKEKEKERKRLKLPRIQAEARLKYDIKAAKTIAITISSYFFCYGPAIVYAVVGLQIKNLADCWFGFIAWYSHYISSAVNPIIYYLRSSRCRSAFKQFLKEPNGSSDFREKPAGRDEKRHDEAITRKRNGENVEGIEACENQTRQSYLGKRRNGLVISSIESLDAGPYAQHKVGDGSGYEKGTATKSGKARASKLQVQNSCQEKEEETEEERYKRSGLEMLSRKRQPSLHTKKVQPLEVTRIGKADPDFSERETKNQKSSETRSNAIILVRSCKDFE